MLSSVVWGRRAATSKYSIVTQKPAPIYAHKTNYYGKTLFFGGFLFFFCRSMFTMATSRRVAAMQCCFEKLQKFDALLVVFDGLCAVFKEPHFVAIGCETFLKISLVFCRQAVSMSNDYHRWIRSTLHKEKAKSNKLFIDLFLYNVCRNKD